MNYPPMDFKGITWAGIICEKFEAMCLEVEEFMYEDTIKYVENQVQKVGVSVKKFYAEVMQDLLPPSCVDPVKVAAADLSVNPYSHSDINKKPKLSLLDNRGECKKNEAEDENISHQTAKVSSSDVHYDLNFFSPLYPTVLVENVCSGVSTTKSKVGVYRRPIGIKRISQTNCPPKILRSKTLSRNRSNMLMCDLRSGCVDASVDMNKTSSLELFVRGDSGEAANEITPLSYASVESFASRKTLPAESVMKEKDDSGCTCPFDKNISSESSRQKKDYECISSSHGLPTKPIDELKKDDSFSQMNPNIGSDAAQPAEEVIVSSEENFHMEVIDNEEVAESGVEIYEPVQKPNLEETCVLVERGKLLFVDQGIEKHNSYKKRICEALTSKLRPTRKQNRWASHYEHPSEKTSANVVIQDLTDSNDWI